MEQESFQKQLHQRLLQMQEDGTKNQKSNQIMISIPWHCVLAIMQFYLASTQTIPISP
jgi:hypothetical protein